MIYNLLSDIICTEVDRVFPDRFSDKAMLIEFGISLDYDKEEGYRSLELMIFPNSRYVQVWTRETWNVISLTDLTNEGDAVPLPGKDYVEGATEWKLLSDHDSCWRSDGVQRFVYENQDKFNVFRGSGFRGWYQIVTPPDNLAELKKKQRGR